jgi:hypothetical protein
MLRALANSGITKVVAESTFGARPGDLIGDLNVLYDRLVLGSEELADFLP